MKRFMKAMLYLFLLVTSSIAVVHITAKGMDYYNQRELNRLEDEKIKSNIPKYVIAPHVVQIFVEDESIKELVGTGTGFYLQLGDKIRLVTNKHICDQSEGKRNMIVKGKKLTILHISKTQDLCIIKPPKSVMTGLKLADRPLELMDEVYLVGHPRGLPLTIRSGHLMSTDIMFFDWIGDSGRTVQYQMISTITYGGNSGSPVTNKDGEVVGVLFAGSRVFITEGLMVPRDTLIRYLMSTWKY